MKIERIVSPEEFNTQGYCIKHGFLTKEECEHFLSQMETYREQHTLPHVYRKVRGRSLDYHVIDGDKVNQHLPEVKSLYQDVNQVVNLTFGQELAPLTNTKVACNINITSPGGEYRWHYDRNAMTSILYLNEVSGGETECYPKYRIFLKNVRYSRLQKLLDNLLILSPVRALFGKQVLVKPRQGSLLLIPGNRCLHSVRPVLGNHDRINIIMAYDTPNATFAVEKQLDNYLYNEKATTSSDPNYQ
jgi:hypothetical protein